MKMNALSLYVTTCRMVFQADINNIRAWNDINRLILYLRQSLTCIVCGQLLKVPMSSSVASCQHHVCKNCIGRKMRLKPSCSWCKDYSKFIENIQLRILLQCYKRLTLYIKRSEISKKWAELQTNNTPGVLIGSSANSIYNQNNCPSNFKDLIDEGSNLQDKYTFFEPPSLRNLNKSTNQSSTKDNLDNKNKLMSKNLISNIEIVEKQDQLIKPQATIVRPAAVENSSINNQLITNSTHLHQLNSHQSNSSSNNSSNSTNQSTAVTPTKSKQPKIRKGCRCGLATLNPGKLTCCGQRCPCYVEGKACFECRCRGCRNNNGNNNTGNNNLMTNKSSSFISTSSINISTNSNLITTTSTSPNLFTSSNLQLNNQTTLLSPVRNLLSPSFLLSNTSSTTLINSSSANQMLRQFQITSSSPSSTILLSGHNNVGNVSTAGVDSLNQLTLPFPTIENIEDQVILSENVACIEEDSTLHQSIIDN